MSRSGTASPQHRRARTTRGSSSLTPSPSPSPAPSPTPSVPPPVAFNIANAQKTFKGKLPVVVRPSSVTAAYASLRTAHIIPSQSSLILAHSSSSSSSSYRGDKRISVDIANAQKALAQSGQASLSLSAADRRAAIKKRAAHQQQERIKEKLWEKASLNGKKTLIGEEAAEVDALVKRIESDRIERRKQWISEEAARREDEDDELAYARARLSRYEERYVEEIARAERLKERANRSKRSSADGRRFGRDMDDSDDESSEDDGHDDEDYEETETLHEGKSNGDRLSGSLPLSKVSSASSTSSRNEMRTASAELLAVREQIRLAEEERRKIEEERLNERARREAERDAEAKRAAALLAAQQAEMQRMIDQLRQQVAQTNTQTQTQSNSANAVTDNTATTTFTPITVLKPTETSSSQSNGDASSSSSSSSPPPHPEAESADGKTTSSSALTTVASSTIGPPLPPRPHPSPPRTPLTDSHSAVSALELSPQTQANLTETQESSGASATANASAASTDGVVVVVQSIPNTKQDYVYTDADDDAAQRDVSRNSVNSSPLVAAQSPANHTREDSMTIAIEGRPTSAMSAASASQPAAAAAHNATIRRSRGVERDEDADFFSGMMKDLAEFEQHEEEICRNGTEITRIPSRGKPKKVKLYLEQRQEGEYFVRWDSNKKPRDAIIQVSACRVVIGLGAFRPVMQSQYKSEAKKCFSLVTTERTLDCVCITSYYADLWTRTLGRLVPQQARPIRVPHVNRTQSLFIPHNTSINGSYPLISQQSRINSTTSTPTTAESSKQIESYLSKHLKGF